MHKYCSLFWSFFKVGTFTIGGGYAMIPLMQREIVDRHHWLEAEEMLDVIALSQALPGVFAVNVAASVGYRLGGLRGGIAAVLGNILMPILLILLIAIFFRRLRDYPLVEHIFMGIRPAVVALIVAPVFRMAKSAHLSWSNCWIPIVAALLIWLLGVSPVIIVLIAIAASVLFYYFNKQHQNT